jgi:hypothetical protein
MEAKVVKVQVGIDCSNKDQHRLLICLSRNWNIAPDMGYSGEPENQDSPLYFSPLLLW